MASTKNKLNAIQVKKWRNQNPERAKAHRIVFAEKRAGRIKQKPCKICKSPKSESHHEDYSKPLDIVWLCKKHHMEADIKRRKRESAIHRKGS